MLNLDYILSINQFTIAFKPSDSNDVCSLDTQIRIQKPMGGINPTGWKNTPYAELLQQFNFNLFEASSRFFRAQALLEKTVIAETRSGEADLETLSNARSELSDMEDLLNESLDIINEAFKVGDEGTWHDVYFKMQYQHIETLRDATEQISGALARDSIRESAKKGELQRSLWFAEVNADVRTQSTQLLNVLTRSMTIHTEYTRTTNVAEYADQSEYLGDPL